MLDIIENEEEDRDTVAPDELERLFNKNYNLMSETAVSLSKSYINKLSVSKTLSVAVSLEDNSIEVFQLNNTSLSRLCRLSGHKKTLTEVVFCPKEPNLLYTSSEDGNLKLWDTRASGSSVQEYKDEGDIPKAYECMDVSHNGRVLCAGSQLVEEDAYLVFWDHRRPAPLGGYWNCHTDDITQVKFHMEKSEVMASGGLDGLVNVFDVAQPSEEEALTCSLNAGNSVERLAWVDAANLACVSQDAALQLWDAPAAHLLRSCPRDRIARALKRTRADDCYVADAFATDDGVTVLAGSHAQRGDVLRSVTLMEKKLQPTTIFHGNKQVVRCSWYDNERDILVTAGEGGLVDVWARAGAGGCEGAASAKLLKPMKKLHLKSNRKKPY